MDPYKEMYLKLFNAAEDAIILLRQEKLYAASRRLIDAQCETEEIFMSATD
ncbi:MAG: hypothetical protein IJV43_00310 [Oscillospiraceae bacterium]|nr:hypothetical protein [Oscillospiraceae bacterium]